MTQSPALPNNDPAAEQPESGLYVALSQTRLRVESSPATEAAFAEALRDVRDAPESEHAWEQLEQLCEVLQRPDEVAEAYLRMLTPARPELVRERLGRRAVAFYDGWFGGDEVAMRSVFEHVIETCADASWAFDRLVSVLTSKERWDALLEAYDRALLSALTPARRRQLLDDAAHVAKDFTDRPERAIGYLRELLKLEAGAQALCASLERVLTERKAFKDLVGLWQAQLDATPEGTTHELRLRIARVYLEELDATSDALCEAANVLARHPGDDQACALLERILALPEADVSLRLSSLHLLRLHHDSADRPFATIAALERSLTFAPAEAQIELRRELAARLMAKGDDQASSKHYAELLRSAPTDADAGSQLERLAQRSANHEAHAQALVSAAEATPDEVEIAELLLSAMEVYSERTANTSAAIALGQRVLTLRGVTAKQTLQATEQLERLLRKTEQTSEQLDVLERLERLETSPYRRRILLSEIAERAHAAGEPERALAAWQTWLEHDPSDLEALSASIELASVLGRHALQVAELERRAKVAPTARQRREDRKQTAILQQSKLADLDAAIATWLSVREEFGDEPDLLQALDELLSTTGRYAELAAIFEGATQRERGLSLSRLCRLGDVHRLELEDYAAAVRAYSRALELDPTCATARSGLCALLGVKGCAREVTTTLEVAYVATDDWALRIELAEARIAATEDPVEQARTMLQVAELCEQRAGDPAAALSWVAKALPRVPSNTQLQRELLRLGELTCHLRETASALHWAALAAVSDRPRAAELSAIEGRLLERLSEHKRAAEAFELVIAVQPYAQYETHALVRNAALAGNYRLACETALHSASVRSMREPSVLESLTSAAAAQRAYPNLCEAFGDALRAQKDLAPELRATLELELANWLLTHCDDSLGAEAAAQRALALQPESPRCLSMLARVQRLQPTPALLDTLLSLDTLTPDSIDPLVEAAELLDTLDVDAERKRAVLSHLFRRAGTLAASGSKDAQQWVLFCIERLIPLDLAKGRSAEALQRLDDAVRLPFSELERAALRRQAAHISHDRGELAEALHLGLTVLEQHPEDQKLVAWLADMAHKLDRVPEQLVLRGRELSLTESSEKRLQLRLEIVRLTGLLEGRDARLSMLRENLREEPGHTASLEEACALLSTKHRLTELLTLLCEQAEAVEGCGKTALSADLWQRAANLAESKLGALEPAISALERVALLRCEASVFDELVRLSRALPDPLRCARFLSQRLPLSTQQERPRVLSELAQAELDAGQLESALDTLQKAFDETPEDLGVRTLLTEQLRKAGRHTDLANVLSRAARETRDPGESKELAMQAARLYHATMQRPDALVAVTDLALGLAPDDAEMCGIMADGLRALGRFEEARQVLMYLLAQYGRRRSVERAAVHVKLAQVLKDEGDLSGSCAQLELALDMQSSDVDIMFALAERSAEALDLTRRERALRALLLCAKRGPVTLENGVQLGVSEVLLQLSELARAREDLEQASRLRESALEALRLDDPECARVKRDLSARGEHDVLAQVLRQELAHAVSSSERAMAMGALADLLSSQGNAAESIELRLSALELDPSDPRLHDAAQAACTPHALDRFRALLEGLRTRLRRPGDAYARCEVCLRLSSLMLAAGDLEGPRELLAEAEATRVREGDVWRAQLGLCAARGELEQQATLLAKLDSLGGAELGDEDRVDVLYRLAEVRLGAEATRKEGLSHMEHALAEAPRPLRAARILLRVLGEAANDPALLELFGKVTTACSAEQLMQLSELCAEEGNAAAIETLLSSVDSAEGTRELRAALLTKRARLLFARDARDREGARLLQEALALVPDDAQAEALLVAYYQETADWHELTLHLAARFADAKQKALSSDCIRYALLLHQHAYDGSAEAVAGALRETLLMAPDATEVRAALLERLTPEEHAHERAEVLEQVMLEAPLNEQAELALEAAALYEACGDLRAAVHVLGLARKVEGQHAGLTHKLIEIFRSQDDAQALSELLAERASSEADPREQAALLREAALLQRSRLDDITASIALLERAVRATPEDGSLRRELAADLLSMGRDEDAIAQLGEAARYCTQHDERALLLCLRGKSLLRQGALTEGIANLEQAFSLAADDLGGELLETLEDARKSAVDRGSEADERDLTLCLARLRRAASDLPSAAELLEAMALRWAMGDAELSVLVELYTELDWAQDLARCLSIQLSRVPSEESPRLVQQLARIIPELDDVSQVRDALEVALMAEPDRQDIEEALMAALSVISDDLSLATLWRVRAEREEDDAARATSLSKAAKHFLAAGRTADASEILRELTLLAPGDTDHALALADTLIEQGNVAEARALLDGLLAESSEGHSVARSRLLLRLAQVAKLMGDKQAALSAMQAARDADSTNRTILGQLAVMAEELEAWAVAEHALTSVLLLKGPEVMPRREALLRRARVAIHHSGKKRALLWARKALEAAPESEEVAQLIRELENAID